MTALLAGIIGGFVGGIVVLVALSLARMAADDPKPPPGKEEP